MSPTHRGVGAIAAAPSAIWVRTVATAGAALALLASVSCSHAPSPSAILDPDKMASVVVGRSSRTDVFAALGRPERTEQSLLGETWIYETKGSDGSGQTLMSGAAAASGVVGAFVPYVGLIGSSLGLAGVAAGAVRQEPNMASVAVGFGDNGVVRDCIYSSTAMPTGVPGSVEGSAKPAGCRRPPQSPTAALPAR